MIVIETPRLILRELAESDAERLFEIYREPGLLEYFSVGPPETVEDARAAIRRHLLRYEEWGFGLWATVLRESDELIGRCGLILQNLDWGKEMEVAYIISRAQWGRGLASEAARAIRDYGFQTLKQERLISLVHVDNERSKHVARAIGMRLERQTKYFGQEVDVFTTPRSGAD
jgi:[ribosomal protein S5]-alanine N-acetyltransferase